MNKLQLRPFLEAMTVKQLKEICSNTRNWGVYQSHTCYSGYSKCRNKKELVDLMLEVVIRDGVHCDLSEDQMRVIDYMETYDYEFIDGKIKRTLIDKIPIKEVSD